MSAALPFVVILIGVATIVASMLGKPKFNVGITEILLAKLPDGVWRVVMLLIGMSIIALGVVGFVETR